MIVSASRPQRPRAIGYIRGDLSGTDLGRHADKIRLRARGLDFELVYIVRIWPTSVPHPLRHVIRIARDLDVAAIIVPDLDHVDCRPAPVCDICALVTVYPEEIWARAQSVYVQSEDLPRRESEMSESLLDAFTHSLPDEHASPWHPLDISNAHRIMQAHKLCQTMRCPRKAAALAVLIDAGKFVPATLSPRERAARRGMHVEVAGLDAELSDDAEIPTLLRVLAGLRQA
ncbi:hypothetical protein ACIP5Y_07275 [Nocardia sp. NPDC088792]|uniref:hypothetical protein n=1 Tax=Nocardia sp. NPDC088792 TaxID=3364332 RepID=UPI00382E0C6A